MEADAYETMKGMLGKRKFTHVILDLQLRDTNVLGLLPQIREDHPSLAILIHTMTDGVKDVVLSQGADEFLSKEFNHKETMAVLTRFLQAHPMRDVPLRQRQDLVILGGRGPESNPFMRLSARERDLVRLMLSGDTSKHIQNVLHLKSSTVSTMKRRVFRKLDISNVVELVKMAETHKFDVDAVRGPGSRP
jgi:DNA-binding NarL/FixJ family response regulator